MSPSEEAQKLCPYCGGKASHIKENDKYYCFSCNKYIEPDSNEEKQVEETAAEEETQIPPQPEDAGVLCPTCQKEPSFITEYDRYYCYTCKTYLAPLEEENIEQPVEEVVPTASVEPEAVSEPEVLQETEATPEDIATQEMDDFIHELEEEGTMAEKDEQEPIGASSRKEKYEKYRYRTRMAKGSFLPIIAGLISIQMLNNHITNFPDYYEYEVMIILSGFLLGFSSLTGITTANLIRARGDPPNGCKLRVTAGVLAYVPFIVINIMLVLFYGMATAWQFSTGFFLAAVFPILIVTLFEASSKGKFFVWELADDPGSGRKLMFVQ
jgi:hypothetical protein